MTQPIWDQIIGNLSLPSQALFRDHCVLLQVKNQGSKTIIVCGTKNESLLSFFYKRLTELQKSVFDVIGKNSEITFTLIDSATFSEKLNQPLVETQCSPEVLALKSKIQKSKGLELTNGQAIALSNLLDFLQTQKQWTFSLEGYAGTGKTFLTKLILDYCTKHDLKVILAAPTNKAAKVLSQISNEEAITIAKMLGIRPKIDQTTGKEVYVPDSEANPPNLENYDLVILDEASMIGAELFKLLSEQFTLFGPKFLFLGDPAQLPPVGEKESPVFTQVEAQAKLTKVVRYSGAILNYATALRTEKKFVPVKKYVDQKTLKSLDKRQFAQTLFSAFDSKEFKDNSDYCRVLAWTNKQVSQWNQQIRSTIFGNQAPQFVSGERLIATSACTRRVEGMKTINGDKFQEVVILPSSGEIVVMEAHQKKEVVKYGHMKGDVFNYWEINAVDEEQNEKTFRVLATSEKPRYEGMLKDFAQTRNWDGYWGLKRAFDSLQYAYALTVHRSQGSTFERVFLDLPNLLANYKSQERKQLLYTAATRASEQLVVLG